MSPLPSSSDMRKTDVHCKCGAYLGQVVIGYVKTIQCYCGECVSVDKPGPDIPHRHQTPSSGVMSA